MSILLFGRAEWSTGPTQAGTLSECSSEGRDVGYQWRRDWCKSGAQESSVQEDIPNEEGVRSNGGWEVFCDWGDGCCEYAKPLLLSVVQKKRVCAYPWAPWSVAALSGASSSGSRPAFAPWDNWVARTGFSWKSTGGGGAGAAEGGHSEGSSGCTGSRAPIRRGLDLWRSWCDRPSIASAVQGVVSGGCSEDGRQLWAHWETVGTVCSDSWARDKWSHLDTRRSFGRFRRFPEFLRPMPDSHCCFAFSQ